MSEQTRDARPTRLGRLADFISQLFPPAIYVPSCIASFAGVHFALQALAGTWPLQVSWRFVTGAASVVLFSLLMRIYDELKDVEADLALGRAGDPKYRLRPIVTGRVRVEDIEALRRWVIAALLVLHLPSGASWQTLGFAVTFGILWWSSKWFFYPAMAKNLLLAFVTHNPIALVIAGYVVATHASERGPSTPDPLWAPLLLGAWFPISAWETARKIRHAPDETAYPTYSKVLGWKVAVWLPVFFIVAATGCNLLVARAAGLGWPLPVALLLAAAVSIGACVRFRLSPSTASANLRPFVELYVVVTTVGLPLGLWLSRGVTWV